MPLPPPPKVAAPNPPSLEELLKRKREQQGEEAKPKFLSKAEREALALERRRNQVASAGGAPVSAAAANGGDGGGRSNQAMSYREAELGRRNERRQRDDESKAAHERAKELELIKQQYLGGEKVRKKVARPTDRMKFVFDWDAKEDTSKDLNPLYNNLHEASLLFGRGMRAGIDRREQKKAAAKLEAKSMNLLRSAAGIEESHETRKADRERNALATRYEGADMRVDQHWTQKKREDMTERDWRIFREDFNIAYRGTNVVRPIRNWDELTMPRELRKVRSWTGQPRNQATDTR